MPYILIIILAIAAAILIFAIYKKRGEKAHQKTDYSRIERSKKEDDALKSETAVFNEKLKGPDTEAEFFNADEEDSFVIGEFDDKGNIINVEYVPLDEIPGSKPDESAEDEDNSGKDE